MTPPRIIARNGHGQRLTHIDLWFEEVPQFLLDCADGCPAELRPFLESRGYTIEEVQPEPEPRPQFTLEAWDFLVGMAKVHGDDDNDPEMKAYEDALIVRDFLARRFLASLERDNP